MTSSGNWKIPLAMAICLPLAVILGYMVADPLRLTSLAVVSAVIGVLMLPVLMKWHYGLLVFSCNAVLICALLPGNPPLWLLATLIAFTFAVINRCLDPDRPLLAGGNVAWALIALAGVVIVTALATGGFGARALGSSSYGGRRYFYIMGAILAYFALASHRVPSSRAKFYVSLFFLSGITALLSNLVFAGGSKFYWLFYIIPAEAEMEQLGRLVTAYGFGLQRIIGLTGVGSAVMLFLLVRYGLRGILDLRKPWRFAVFATFLVIGVFSGFRSFVGCMFFIFAAAFFIEGLHRTPYLALVLVLGLAFGIALITFSNQLPLTVQRALCFLPIKVDQTVQYDAQNSLEWRLEMWQILANDVPRYLLLGKGCALRPEDLALSYQNAFRGYGPASEWAIISGDYHNGPLSVLLPFGIWGALALGWFFLATGRMLYRNCKYGAPELLTINRALFACFVGRVISFLFLVGALHLDLPFFTCLAGLAVSLNRDVTEAAPQVAAESVPALAVPRIGLGSRL